MTNIYDIPTDIIDEILNYLNNQDYYSSLLTCKLFHTFDKNLVTYQRLLYRKYNNKTIDQLVLTGDLDGIKWLHNNGKEGFTYETMDCAAKYGYLDMIQWLHQNREEGCTYKAMDWAARDGHLDVVEYLKSIKKID